MTLRDSLINTIRYQWLHEVKGGDTALTSSGLHTCLSNNDKIVFNFLKTTLDDTTLKFALTLNIRLQDTTYECAPTECSYTSSECSLSESRDCILGADQVGPNAVTVDTDDTTIKSVRITLTAEDNDASVTHFQITHTPFNGILFKDNLLENPINSGDILHISTTRSVMRTSSRMKRSFNTTSNTNSINVFYKPNSDFHGSDTFMFRVKDASTSKWSASDALVEVKMYKHVDPPTSITQIGDERIEVSKHELRRIDLNAHDNGGSIMLYEIVCTPVRGLLFRTQNASEDPLSDGDQIMPANGQTSVTVYYRSNEHVQGSSDMFTFKVKDTRGQWSVSNGNVEIHILNTVPIAKSQIGENAVLVSESNRSAFVYLECDTDTGSVPACFQVERLPLNGTLYKDAGFTTPVDAGTPLLVETTTTTKTLSRGRVKNNIMIEYGVRNVSKPRTSNIPTAPPNSVTLYYKPNDTAFYGSDSFTFNATDQSEQTTIRSGTVELKVERIVLPTPTSQSGENSLTAIGSKATEIVLSGNDIPDGSNSEFKISCFPTAGNLYIEIDEDGNGNASSKIGPTTTIQELSSSSTKIYYKANTSQGGPNDTFTFIVGYNSSSGRRWSVETGLVELKLESDNKNPTAVSIVGDDAIIVPQDKTIPLMFHISGTDTDGVITTFQITNLPFNGKLYNNPLMLDEHCIEKNVDLTPQQTQQRIFHPQMTRSVKSLVTLSNKPRRHIKRRRNLNSVQRSMSGSNSLVSQTHNNVATENSSSSSQENSLTLYYKATSDFTGSDVFTFKVRDNFHEWSTKDGIVEIKVPKFHNFPAPTSLTGNDAINVQSGDEVTVNLTGIDGDGTITAFEIASVPIHGMLYDENQIQLAPGSTLPALVDADHHDKKYATLTYVSETNFYGCDVITFRVIDAIHAWKSHPAHVELNVAGANPVPVSQVDDNAIYATHHTMSQIVLTELNTVDEYEIVLSPFNGKLHAVIDEQLCTIETINRVTCEFEYDLYYKPNEDFIGSDVFTFKLRDSMSGLWSLQTGTIQLKVVEAPVAENIYVQVDDPQSITTINIDTGVAQFKVTELPIHGTLYLDAQTSNEVQLNTPIEYQTVLYYKHTSESLPSEDIFRYQVFDRVWSDPNDTNNGTATLQFTAARDTFVSMAQRIEDEPATTIVLSNRNRFFQIVDPPNPNIGTLYNGENGEAVEPNRPYEGKTVYFKRS